MLPLCHRGPNSIVETTSVVSNMNDNEDFVKLFDIRDHSSDKYLTNLLSFRETKHITKLPITGCSNYDLWKSQTDYDFGFVALGAFVLPNCDREGIHLNSPIEQHKRVRAINIPNFMGVRTPVLSQLNVEAWEKYLKTYWDHQLIHLIKYGFPLDFNRTCALQCDKNNHDSAVQ